MIRQVTVRRNSSRRRGFTLYEMLVAIGMMMLAINLGAELFHVNGKLVQQAEEMATTTSRIDSAMHQMRRDVWGATKIDAADSKTVALMQTDGSQINWQVAADGLLIRTAGKQTTQWPDIAKDWAFAADGAQLTISDKTSQGSQSVQLVSQILLSASVGRNEQ